MRTNSHPDDDPKTVSPVNRNEVLTYWLNRLVPLVGSDVHFVCANRVAGGVLVLTTGTRMCCVCRRAVRAVRAVCTVCAVCADVMSSFASI